MADDLTRAQDLEIKGDLDRLLLEIDALLNTPSDRTDVVDLDQPIGRLSRMDAMQQQKMAEAQVRRHKLRLRQVKQALAAYEDGEFGDCRKCDEPVGYRRLKARPESPFCVQCQEEIEARR